MAPQRPTPLHRASGSRRSSSPLPSSLAGATKAEAVVLFGSRARGDHNEDSDWDLCVLPDDVPWGRYTALTLWPLVADLPAAIQVVPLRRSVFEAKRDGVDNLSHDIARDGVVIHGTLDGMRSL